MSECYLIFVAGGTASGKTTVCNEIVKELSQKKVVVVCLDSFYKPASQINDNNFDVPQAFDFDLLYETLNKMKKKQTVEIPLYDFVTGDRLPKSTIVPPADVVLLEGILVLYDKRIRELADLAVYTHCDADARLARRLMRDVQERGRTMDSVLEQYLSTVKPAHDEYVAKGEQHAHFTVNCTAKSVMGPSLDLFRTFIKSKLSKG